MRQGRGSVGSAFLTVYVAVAMPYRAFVAHDVAVLDWDVLIAACAVVCGLWTRVKVTPVAEPKDTNRVRLVPVDRTTLHGNRM